MYLAFTLLCGFFCDAPFNVLFNTEQMCRSRYLSGLPRHQACRGGRIAHLYFSIAMHLKSFQALTLKVFLVCFGLPSTNKKFFTSSMASLAMTKTFWSQRILQICSVFVIASSPGRTKQSVIIQQNTN